MSISLFFFKEMHKHRTICIFREEKNSKSTENILYSFDFLLKPSLTQLTFLFSDTFHITLYCTVYTYILHKYTVKFVRMHLNLYKKCSIIFY